MGFEITSLDLTMANPETGEVLQTNLYRVDGIERDLSISELVMAICLQIATEKEEEIVSMMEEMTRDSVNLEALTAIQEALVEGEDGHTINEICVVVNYYDKVNGKNTDLEVSSYGTLNELLANMQLDTMSEEDAATSVATMSHISSQMDALNSVSQTDMIELQSMTNKRDQAYDLITNMLKSMYSIMSANLNNY